MHEEYGIILSSVSRSQVNGSPLYGLVVRLKELKKKLKVFHKQFFGGIGKRVANALADLPVFQKALLNNPNDKALSEKEDEALKLYSKMLRYENLFLKDMSW